MAKNPKLPGTKVSLITTEDPEVKLSIKPGLELRVVEVDFITPDLKSAPRIAARLCGMGSNVCLAVVETG